MAMTFSLHQIYYDYNAMTLSTPSLVKRGALRKEKLYVAHLPLMLPPHNKDSTYSIIN
jgi:hypothetical protein